MIRFNKTGKIVIKLTLDSTSDHKMNVIEQFMKVSFHKWIFKEFLYDAFNIGLHIEQNRRRKIWYSIVLSMNSAFSNITNGVHNIFSDEIIIEWNLKPNRWTHWCTTYQIKTFNEINELISIISHIIMSIYDEFNSFN